MRTSEDRVNMWYRRHGNGVTVERIGSNPRSAAERLDLERLCNPAQYADRRVAVLTKAPGPGTHPEVASANG